jgi:6-phosphogluconolactonase
VKHLFFLTALAASSSIARPIYIGTGADGIFLAHFDSETDVLTEPALAAKYEAPGFLALHPVKPVLHCVGGGNTFSIAEDHSLTLLGSAPSGGKGPCHLAIDASGRTLAVANYGGGSFATIRLDADGKPGEIISLEKPTGSGSNKNRQEAAHAHGVYFDKASRSSSRQTSASTKY